MDVIRFVATVGEDQVIHPPGGVRVPAGVVDVTVVARLTGSASLPETETSTLDDSSPSLGDLLLELAAEAERIASPLPADLAATRNWLLGIAAAAEALDPPMPTDMAMNHDHYAHGKPLA